MGIQGLGFRVFHQGPWFRDEGVGFRNYSLEFRV